MKRITRGTLGLVAALAAMASVGCGRNDETVCPSMQCDGYCVDVTTDPRHCGACGNACGEGLACVDGACTLDCAAGLTSCDGSCRDLTADPKNCGGCGSACAEGQVCSAGACALTCQSGLESCEGFCRDLQTDRLTAADATSPAQRARSAARRTAASPAAARPRPSAATPA
jgi:hypothetical protein